MATKISNVLYVKVGNVTVTKLENQKRQELISGIKKYPVSKAYLTKTGFVDDFQADLVHSVVSLIGSCLWPFHSEYGMLLS